MSNPPDNLIKNPLDKTRRQRSDEDSGTTPPSEGAERRDPGDNLITNPLDEPDAGDNLIKNPLDK